MGIHAWKVNRAIAEKQKTVVGTIIAHEPANHNRYGYTFVLGGKSHTGWETPRKENPRIGQRVLVYYDPSNPAKNALTDFNELAARSLGPVPLLLFGIGAVAFVILFRRRTNPA